MVEPKARRSTCCATYSSNPIGSYQGRCCYDVRRGADHVVDARKRWLTPHIFGAAESGAARLTMHAEARYIENRREKRGRNASIATVV